RARFAAGAGREDAVRTFADLVVHELRELVVVHRPLLERRNHRRIRSAQEIVLELDHVTPAALARLVAKPSCEPSVASGCLRFSCHSSDSIAILSGLSWMVSSYTGSS